jgi:hypothetical protein
MEVADTLAYYNTEKIMIVKSFIVLALGHFFMIQIDGYLQRTITILQEVSSTNIGSGQRQIFFYPILEDSDQGPML